MQNIDIERKELAKFRLNSATMAGLIIGVVSSLLLFGADFFKDNKTVLQVLGYCEFFAVCGGFYYFTKQYVVKRADFGVTFTHALGFMMIITIFASILVGITTYYVMFILSPEYYIEMYKNILSSTTISGGLGSFKDVYTKLGSMPLLVIIYSMITTIIKWVFPAMIISAMLRNSSDPMQGFKKYINQTEDNK